MRRRCDATCAGGSSSLDMDRPYTVSHQAAASALSMFWLVSSFAHASVSHFCWQWSVKCLWYACFVLCLCRDWFCGLTWERVYRWEIHICIWWSLIVLRWPCVADSTLNSNYQPTLSVPRHTTPLAPGPSISLHKSGVAWCNCLRICPLYIFFLTRFHVTTVQCETGIPMT